MSPFKGKEVTTVKCAVLIPCYEPDEKLKNLCMALSAKGLYTLVVNDGSTKNLEIFDDCAKINNIEVTGYAENRGKGHALKVGFEYLRSRGYNSCVTADSDGQHTPEDILRIMAELEKNPTKLILGVRDKSLMPPKSKIGNEMTCKLFRLLYGIRLSDTQTGLRGIPFSDFDGLMSIKSERYEYEMEMLIDSGKLFSGIIEIPIETIYIEDNRGSHFRPIKDGAKIYSVLFGKLPIFLVSSLISFIIDYGLFNLFYYVIFKSSTVSTVIARAISGSANFLINRNVVFKGNSEKYTFWRYWTLALCILAANLLLIKLLVDIAGLPAFFAKIIVEIILYFVNFIIQNRWTHK